MSAGASADPAGLTARARPEARPDKRAANLHKPTYRKDEAEWQRDPDSEASRCVTLRFGSKLVPFRGSA